MPGVKAYTRPARNSNVSPLRGGANAPLILLTAMFVVETQQPIAQPINQTPPIAARSEVNVCRRSIRGGCRNSDSLVVLDTAVGKLSSLKVEWRRRGVNC